MRIGIIGFGYWGTILARCFARAPHVEICCIADIAPERLVEARRQFPNAVLTSTSAEAVDMEDADVLVIATPSNTHHEIAKAALEAGKHVWIEKPVAETAEQATALVLLAQERKRLLFIDHTYIYSDSIRLIKQMMAGKDFGEMQRYHSVRINNGRARKDSSVFHDLAVHDLAILDFLVGEGPLAVAVTGQAEDEEQHIALTYSSGLKAEIRVNWCAPDRVRRITISSHDQSIEFDDTQLRDKVRIHQHLSPGAPAINFGDIGAGRHNGSVLPLESTTETLANAVENFLHCIRTGEKPASDGWQGVRLAAILDACLSSVKGVGQWTEVGR